MIDINQFIELMHIMNMTDWVRLEKFCLQLAAKERDMGHFHNETIIQETLDGMNFRIKRNISKQANPLSAGQKCPKCSCGVLVEVDSEEQSKEPHARLQCSYCWFHGVKHRN